MNKSKMNNMRDLLPEKYWGNLVNGKLVSEKWRVETSSKSYDGNWNAHWTPSNYADEKPSFVALEYFLTSLKPEFIYAQYLGLEKMIHIVENDYWDYYSKGKTYNYEIDFNELLEYLTKECGYNFD